MPISNQVSEQNVLVLSIDDLLQDPNFKPICNYGPNTPNTAKEQITEIAEYAYSMGYLLTTCIPNNLGGIVVFVKR
jgi:hypothetical protein